MYEKLCRELALTAEYQKETQLAAIKNYCYEQVSRDVAFKGNAVKVYAEYLAFVAHYLNNFLENIPENPIQYAARKGYDRYLEKSVLPENWLNQGDQYGMTAVHAAAVEGHLYCLKILLEKGASPDSLNEQGQKPIYSAIFVPMLHDADLIERKEAIFRLLLPLTKEVFSMEDHAGNTVCHQLATNNFDRLLREILAEDSKQAFSKNHARLAPIHLAILNQSEQACLLLLAIPGVPLLEDARNRLPLHYAAMYGTAAITEACSKVSPDLNVRDGENNTALFYAKKFGNQAAAQVLIAAGAIGD